MRRGGASPSHPPPSSTVPRLRPSLTPGRPARIRPGRRSRYTPGAPQSCPPSGAHAAPLPGSQTSPRLPWPCQCQSWGPAGLPAHAGKLPRKGPPAGAPVCRWLTPLSWAPPTPVRTVRLLYDAQLGPPHLGVVLGHKRCLPPASGYPGALVGTLPGRSQGVPWAQWSLRSRGQGQRWVPGGPWEGLSGRQV